MIKGQMEKISCESSPNDIPWNMETPPEELQALIRNNVLSPRGEHAVHTAVYAPCRKKTG